MTLMNTLINTKLIFLFHLFFFIYTYCVIGEIDHISTNRLHPDTTPAAQQVFTLFVFGGPLVPLNGI